MKKISLSHWICSNKEKWQTICRINNKRFTIEEVWELLDEMEKLAYYKKEFGAIYTIIYVSIIMTYIIN